LLAYLKKTPEGEIADTAELEELLAECWDEFVGDYGGMEPYKLFGRMEDVSWSYPILEFVIERHGGTAMGSSRAELQYWTLDVEHKTRSMYIEGYRQVEPRAAPVDVKPIADELVRLITAGSKDPRLQWSAAGHVRILTGKILPTESAVKQTLEGRRRRLNNAIAERLLPLGWQQEGLWWRKES
jgi:hypothetical protein